MNYGKIGAFVKEKRKAMNLTQSELAQLAEIHYRSVQNIEAGKKVYLDTLKKVLKLLGYNVQIVDDKTAEVIKFD